MLTTNPTNLYREAKKRMLDIDREVNRPEEDAVAPFIGNSSRQCIKDFLTGFLTEQGIHIEGTPGIDYLLNRCQTIDPRFMTVDPDAAPCLSAADDSNLDQARKCYEVAQQIQDLVRSASANRL
jgi:hypothetical protein